MGSLPSAWQELLKPFVGRYPIGELVRKPGKAMPVDKYLGIKGAEYQVTIPGDITVDSAVLRNLPYQLEVKGSMTIAADNLHFLAGKSVDIRGDLIVTYFDTPPRIDDVAGIDGLSVRDIKFVRRQRRSEGREKEGVAERIARMSRDQFADYLKTHRSEFAKAIRNPAFLDSELAWEEVYEKLTLKPRYRALPTMEFAPRDANTIRAMNAYEAAMQTLKQKEYSGRGFVRGGQKSTNWASWTFGEHKLNVGSKKAYITLKDAVKDLQPATIEALQSALEGVGYKGAMKVTVRGRRARVNFDNIVLHASGDMLLHAVSTISKKFRELGVAVEAVEFAQDPAEEAGESHSSSLAKSVVRAWKSV